MPESASTDALSRQLLAGAGAGAITKTSIAPLERVKILMQLEGMAHGGGERKYRSLGQSLVRVVSEEGVLSLWKGNGANVARVMPVYALKFAFNDYFKALARSMRRGTAGKSSAGATADARKLTWGEKVIAGTLAGTFQIMITYPLEVIRTRLTLGPGLGIQYKGMVDTAVSTLRSEGIMGLYKGTLPTLLSGAPYVGLQMSGFDFFKTSLGASRVPFLTSTDGSGDPRVTILGTLASGAAAGVLAQTLTYPGDTIRRRMQTNGAGGAELKYRSAYHCLTETVAKEGVAGLYRGVVVNAIRSIPGAAIQFVAYDQLKRVLGV